MKLPTNVLPGQTSNVKYEKCEAGIYDNMIPQESRFKKIIRFFNPAKNRILEDFLHMPIFIYFCLQIKVMALECLNENYVGVDYYARCLFAAVIIYPIYLIYFNSINRTLRLVHFVTLMFLIVFFNSTLIIFQNIKGFCAAIIIK